MAPGEGVTEDAASYSSELAVAKHQLASLESTARLLKKQNRQLQADLRSAQSGSIIAERLHKEVLQKQGSAEPSFATFVSEDAAAAKSQQDTEIEALKEELERMRHLLEEERSRSIVTVVDNSRIEAASVEQPPAESHAQCPLSARLLPTPAPAAAAAGSQQAREQRRSQRRYQQMATITRRVHEENIRQRTQGFSEAGSFISDVSCAGSLPARGAAASRGRPSSVGTQADESAMGRSPGTQSNISSIRTQNSAYLASINALQRRFSLRRDLRCK
eukprot:TRINITY_DN21934_c0_g1_i1.p1 TRINITY_DN21934_c0_g1~~TRINITY_DN21934_c0_g1_i1.p1  ORF type:complete len:301 (-),score=51.98 TRINITY_DN21934_c0_g1_i1:208-1032(-)